MSPFCLTKKHFRLFAAELALAAVLILALTRNGVAGGWPEVKIRLLSDDCFAVVEYDKNGAKTRHCPHHDTDGRLDMDQLIWVLGTLDRIQWIDPKNAELATRHLEKHFDRFKHEVSGKPLPMVNINAAALTQLVRLPQIGPRLAVKIVQYREAHKRFGTIDAIEQIEGIGPGTFAALRHYITVD